MIPSKSILLSFTCIVIKPWHTNHRRSMSPELRLDPQPGLEVLEGESCRRQTIDTCLASCRCRAQ